MRLLTEFDISKINFDSIVVTHSQEFADEGGLTPQMERDSCTSTSLISRQPI